MIVVIDTVRPAFRGNYETEAEAMASVRSLRNNFYLLDDPMMLIRSEAFSLRELAILLKQFESDTSARVLEDRATLVGKLWHHWQDWGLRPFRKNSR